MKRYIRKFEENFDLDSFIESYQIKEAANNIAATSMESFYNMLNMYKELEREDCDNKKKMLKKLKSLLVDFVTIDSMLSKTFNYKGIAGTHYRF